MCSLSGNFLNIGTTIFMLFTQFLHLLGSSWVFKTRLRSQCLYENWPLVFMNPSFWGAEQTFVSNVKLPVTGQVHMPGGQILNCITYRNSVICVNSHVSRWCKQWMCRINGVLLDFYFEEFDLWPAASLGSDILHCKSRISACLCKSSACRLV